MPPEQDSMILWNLVDLFNHHFDNILKVPKQIKRSMSVRLNDVGSHDMEVDTYLLPAGSLFGLISSFLKCAKKSSTGLV